MRNFLGINRITANEALSILQCFDFVSPLAFNSKPKRKEIRKIKRKKIVQICVCDTKKYKQIKMALISVLLPG